jgi:hypothetical protein
MKYNLKLDNQCFYCEREAVATCDQSWWLVTQEVLEQVLGKLECWPVLRFSMRFRVTGLAGSSFGSMTSCQNFRLWGSVRYISI